jgi:hypothetical protein
MRLLRLRLAPRRPLFGGASLRGRLLLRGGSQRRLPLSLAPLFGLRQRSPETSADRSDSTCVRSHVGLQIELLRG